MTSASGRNSLAIVLLITLLSFTLPLRRQQQVSHNYKVDERISVRIVFVNFAPADERTVRMAMSSMFTCECTQAFKDADLLSPLEVVLQTGIILRPSEDIYIYKGRLTELGLMYEETRKRYASQFSSGRAPAGIVRPFRQGVQLTVDGRPRLFLHSIAFLGESFLFGRPSLREVLIHEMIHAGGQPPTPGRLGALRHDLAGFEHYDRIMAACSGHN